MGKALNNTKSKKSRVKSLSFKIMKLFLEIWIASLKLSVICQIVKLLPILIVFAP